MAVRKAEAIWEGTLKEGSGKMNVGSGAFSVPFSFATRFEEEPGTNPEELAGAAHAGCFSMFLSAQLTNNEFPPSTIETTATVTLGDSDGPFITNITLNTRAKVPGIGQEKFDELVAVSKAKCPISRLFAGVGELTVNATLES